ncbi:MAG TPA: GtrA family protein [Magnetospirillum sp.]|jgi:putative flippase GtrA|nr:GtrA family protein [Magnetospirillum sp.]
MKLPPGLLSFAAVGVAGFVVDAATLHLAITLFGAPPLAGRALSYLAAATATWALNRAYTFAPTDDKLLTQWLRFLAVNAFGGAVNYAVYAGLVTSAPPFTDAPVLAVAVGSLFGLAFNYLFSSMLVFRKT